MTRPDCWDFAMSFLGDPEATEVEAYVTALEATVVSKPDYNPPADDAKLADVLRYTALAWRESLTVRRKHMVTPELLEAAANKIERLEDELRGAYLP
jgi:hypothetical protein